jgi:hypothetical protein
MHSKLRNRLQINRAKKLVYCYWNLRILNNIPDFHGSDIASYDVSDVEAIEGESKAYIDAEGEFKADT